MVKVHPPRVLSTACLWFDSFVTVMPEVDIYDSKPKTRNDSPRNSANRRHNDSLDSAGGFNRAIIDCLFMSLCMRVDLELLFAACWQTENDRRFLSEALGISKYYTSLFVLSVTIIICFRLIDLLGYLLH